MNPIIEENRRAGTRHWLPPADRMHPGFTRRLSGIEAYPSVYEAEAGQTVEIRVSAGPPTEFRADLYRSGWYGGDGARHIESFGPFHAEEQDWTRCLRSGAVICDWPAAFSFSIRSEWLSGFYFLKLTSVNDEFTYVPLVVTDRRETDILFQCSDFTWLAYNRWPERSSLYDRDGKFWYVGPGTVVSDARPYATYCQIVDSILSLAGEYFLWEYPIAYWLEKEGYDVSYVTNLTLDWGRAGLDRAPVFISAGHDEYYTLPMYEELAGAIERGLNVLFLSSNVCCGRVETVCRPETDGHLCLRRVDRFGHTCDEELALFPESAEYPWASPGERDLVGVRNLFPLTGGADWICVRPDHWAFEDTGMKAGDAVEGLVGWEWMGDPGGYEDVAVLARGEAKGNRGGGIYSSCLCTARAGNFVFSASTCWWGAALAAPPGFQVPERFVRPRGPDARVQKLTSNLIRRGLRSD